MLGRLTATVLMGRAAWVTLPDSSRDRALVAALRRLRKR